MTSTASALVARDGAQVSLKEIAREAGVGSATLHRHFPSRRVLLEEVFQDTVERLRRRAAAGDDPRRPWSAGWKN
ncbi:TetR/AcrR family transcriptional regulator [Actinomadura chokoriensis]|uniref:TetR/AcrR family transcriptional regulator n=1 Tax=Actinomadura chokoriensis TaxID=454156 RepID=UPI003D15C22D